MIALDALSFLEQRYPDESITLVSQTEQRPTDWIKGAAALALKQARDTSPAEAGVVSFGELLLRLAAPDHGRLDRATQLDVHFGGAESNVAVALAQMGLRSRFVSRVPDNAIAKAGLGMMHGLRVDISRVIFGGDRLGIYFLESGVSQRPSRVIYDRSGSSMAAITAGEVDWGEVLHGHQWLHTSGITPALSQSAATACVEAVKAAKRASLTVSVDLNYRNQLWRWASSPTETMSALLDHADVVFTNEEDLDMVFGIKVPSPLTGGLALDPRRYSGPCSELQNRFPSLRAVAVTVRESVSASDNYWSAALSTKSGFYTSHRYHIMPVLDRVGAGDAFAAAAIRQMILGTADDQEVVEFAAAAG